MPVDKKNFRSLILVLTCLLSACHPRVQESGDPEPEPLPPLGFYTDRYEADTLQVRSGETFTGLMGRLGMPAQDAYTLGQLCDSTFDVRKLRAGNPIHAYYDITDSTRALRYAVYVQDIVRSTVFRCAVKAQIYKGCL